MVSLPDGAALPTAGHVRLVAASGLPVQLATRTLCVILAAAAVAVALFPAENQAPGPGSRLALRLALGAGLPVFVAGSVVPGPASRWSPALVGGVSGWACPPVRQPSLF